jgi:hypothetical protein
MACRSRAAVETDQNAVDPALFALKTRSAVIVKISLSTIISGLGFQMSIRATFVKSSPVAGSTGRIRSDLAAAPPWTGLPDDITSDRLLLKRMSSRAS